jgi:hypothetical protein
LWQAKNPKVCSKRQAVAQVPSAWIDGTVKVIGSTRSRLPALDMEDVTACKPLGVVNIAPVRRRLN